MPPAIVGKSVRWNTDVELEPSVGASVRKVDVPSLVVV
jgi:hypothetical protein